MIRSVEGYKVCYCGQFNHKTIYIITVIFMLLSKFLVSDKAVVGSVCMGVDPWVDRGTCPPYFLKWRGSVLSPLLFWEWTLFVMHSTDYVHRSFRRIIG